jgi:hypothetical protein
MPLTATDFRRLALSFPDAEERSHMRHPDFRVAGKIFATLGYPNNEFGMVRVTPEQQEELVHDEPDIFVPVKGAWGRQGCTHVRLKSARKPVLARALEAAYRNTLATAAKSAKSRKRPRA